MCFASWSWEFTKTVALPIIIWEIIFYSNHRLDWGTAVGHRAHAYSQSSCHGMSCHFLLGIATRSTEEM